jgi:lipoate-protein ligase A
LTFSLEGDLDGVVNMGRDADLLRAAEAGEPGCRVYGWDGAWISLGKFQNPSVDLLPGCPAPWVMRPTGGRGVLHGHDVTVGLAWPLALLAEPGEDPVRLSRSVRRAYRRLALPLIAAMRDVGVPAALGEQTRFAGTTPKSADCFAHVAANDIVDERTGQKVCGCALRLTERAALVQASIPARRPLVDPALVFPDPAPVAWSLVDKDRFGAALREALGGL